MRIGMVRQRASRNGQGRDGRKTEKSEFHRALPKIDDSAIMPI
jgi:hypothetical protein